MYLCDVTIREGGQLPGREYTADQKIQAAKTLDDLGIEYIQATFPATGKRDRTVTEELADTLDANVVALARAVPSDIDVSVNAGADVVEIFGTVSQLHLNHVVHQGRAEMLDAFEKCIARVREADVTPQLILTDAFRTDIERLQQVYERFPNIEVVTLADTVGTKHPREVEQFFQRLTSDIDPSRIGVHFHDDLGVATANLLIAHEFGIKRGDVSVAALGERAGNSALEETIVSAVLAEKGDFGVKIEELIPACHEILETLDESVTSKKAILGYETLEHEAGIHTQAMLDKPETFEAFDPTRFGGRRRLLFGEQTGRTGARLLLERADAAVNDEAIERVIDLLSRHGPVELTDAIDLIAATNEEE